MITNFLPEKKQLSTHSPLFQNQEGLHENSRVLSNLQIQWRQMI